MFFMHKKMIFVRSKPCVHKEEISSSSEYFDYILQFQPRSVDWSQEDQKGVLPPRLDQIPAWFDAPQVR